MKSWHADGAAPIQQPPELEGDEARTAGTPPACLRASRCLSTTDSTASPNRPRGASGASNRKTLSLSLMMPLCCHHGCHRPPNSTGDLLGGAESQISGSPVLRDVIGAHGLALIHHLQQVSLVCLLHRHGVQTCTSLTRCRVPLAHKR